jgi:mRNA-degrading endonuclease RelE of RelBE toxin-antitoxin system
MIKKITRSPVFIKQVKHLDSFLLKKIKKQILKIIENPLIGKPLKYYQGERSLYVKPFRLIYSVKGEELILLKFEHRKSVYH